MKICLLASRIGRFGLRVFRAEVDAVDAVRLVEALERERVDVAILRLPADASARSNELREHGLAPIVADRSCVTNRCRDGAARRLKSRYACDAGRCRAARFAGARDLCRLRHATTTRTRCSPRENPRWIRRVGREPCAGERPGTGAWLSKRRRSRGIFVLSHRRCHGSRDRRPRTACFPVPRARHLSQHAAAHVARFGSRGLSGSRSRRRRRTSPSSESG